MLRVMNALLEYIKSIFQQPHQLQLDHLVDICKMFTAASKTSLSLDVLCLVSKNLQKTLVFQQKTANTSLEWFVLYHNAGIIG